MQYLKPTSIFMDLGALYEEQPTNYDPVFT